MRPKRTIKRTKKAVKTRPEPAVEFTEASIRAAAPADGDYTINDPKTSGLSVKITPAGRKVFIFRYRTEFGRQRKLSIGTWPEISVSEARRMAAEHRAEIYRGNDPAGDRMEKRRSMKVSEFVPRYLHDQVRPRLAPSTYKEYATVLETRVVPRIGHLALVEVSRADIEALHASMADTPVRANRMLSVVKAMLYKAEDWGVLPRGSNPAARIRMNKERPKRRYFSDDEQRRLFSAIEKLRSEMPRSQTAFNAILLLFYTGCRPSEVLNLKWECIDLDAGLASLHNTKTGEGRLPLARGAVSVLQSIAKERNGPWVFPGAVSGDRLKSLKRPWERICSEAGLQGACLKDIRHTVGTYVAKEGGLYSAQVVLRHTSPRTTLRYAHPFEKAVRSHLETAVNHIENNRSRGRNS